MRAIHGARRGALEVNAFAVVAAAVAGTLEFVFAGFPVGRAAQMSATREDDKDTIGCAVHPDAVFLLPLGVHAQSVVRGIADFEDRGWFKKRARQEKTKEGDEPGTEETHDGAPYQAAAALVDQAVVRSGGGDARSGCGFGSTHGRRANIAGCLRGDSSRLGCVEFRFVRRGLRARHAYLLKTVSRLADGDATRRHFPP